MSLDERIDSLKIDRSAGEGVGGAGAARWLGLAVLLVAALGAAGWWLTDRSRPPEVRAEPVREVLLSSGTTVLNASGYVTARRQATVSSKVTGRVREVLIEEGMHVRTGQVLARLDDTNARANLALAQAELDAARTALQETRVRLRQAELDLERLGALRERAVVSQAELDAARAEVDSLRARLDQQAKQATVAERRVDVWRQEIADRVIRAPFAGVVVSKDAQPGEMISPVSAGGGFTRTGIGTIVDMDSLEIEVDVNESYINRVAPGQQVEALLDAYPDWRIPARVIAIVPTADRQRATVKVRIAFERLDPRILPDMGVKVAFRQGESGPERRGLAIPRAALRQESGQAVVFVLQDGRVRRRAVRVAEVQGERAIVADGLRAGERVVVGGPERLEDGMAVSEADGVSE